VIFPGQSIVVSRTGKATASKSSRSSKRTKD
jgi:hypothetical protein